MARRKEFDPNVVLQAAIIAFAEHGFEGTSTDELLQAMSISRQSLYDTFGDKRQLYMAALRRYNAQNVSDLIRTLNSAGSPLKGIEAALLKFADDADVPSTAGCLGISAVCEFGRSDEEIVTMVDLMGDALISALERRLTDAQAMGEIGADIAVADAAQFLSSTLSGMKVSTRAGASAAHLRAIATIALRSLR